VHLQRVAVGVHPDTDHLDDTARNPELQLDGYDDLCNASSGRASGGACTAEACTPEAGPAQTGRELQELHRGTCRRCNADLSRSAGICEPP